MTAGWFQAFLDGFYYCRKFMIDFLAYITMRIYALEVTFSEVSSRTYDSRQHQDLALDNAGDLESLLGLAEQSLESAEERRKAVAAKCSILLTLGSLLVGLTVALLPKQLAFARNWEQALATVAIALLLNVIVLLLVIFDVGVEQLPAIGQEHVELSDADLKKSRINDLRRCSASQENKNDYLVDVYKAARFCFLASLTLISVLVLGRLILGPQDADSHRLITELRGNPTLLDLLRGPRGEKGDRGDEGSTGPARSPSDAEIERVVRRVLGKQGPDRSSPTPK